MRPIGKQAVPPLPGERIEADAGATADPARDIAGEARRFSELVSRPGADRAVPQDVPAQAFPALPWLEHKAAKQPDAAAGASGAEAASEAAPVGGPAKSLPETASAQAHAHANEHAGRPAHAQAHAWGHVKHAEAGAQPHEKVDAGAHGTSQPGDPLTSRQMSARAAKRKALGLDGGHARHPLHTQESRRERPARETQLASDAAAVGAGPAATQQVQAPLTAQPAAQGKQTHPVTQAMRSARAEQAQGLHAAAAPQAANAPAGFGPDAVVAGTTETAADPLGATTATASATTTATAAPVAAATSSSEAPQAIDAGGASDESLDPTTGLPTDTAGAPPAAVRTRQELRAAEAIGADIQAQVVRLAQANFNPAESPLQEVVEKL